MFFHVTLEVFSRTYYLSFSLQSHRARDVIIRREDDVAECATYPDVDRLEKFGECSMKCMIFPC